MDYFSLLEIFNILFSLGKAEHRIFWLWIPYNCLENVIHIRRPKLLSLTRNKVLVTEKYCWYNKDECLLQKEEQILLQEVHIVSQEKNVFRWQENFSCDRKYFPVTGFFFAVQGPNFELTLLSHSNNKNKNNKNPHLNSLREW